MLSTWQGSQGQRQPPRPEVTEYIKQLKQNPPRALISVDGQEAVFEMTETPRHADGSQVGPTEDISQRADDDDESESSSTEFTYVREETQNEAEESLSNQAFILSASYDNKQDMKTLTGIHPRTANMPQQFLGVRIDTGANRTSIISCDQSKEYW